MRPARAPLACLSALLFLVASPALAQDNHILLPVEEIERRLTQEDFRVVQAADTRFEGDRTQRSAIMFTEDSLMMIVKFAAAVRGGETFNNVPRYEVGVYGAQKLFLDEPDFVVPPTIMRAFPLSWYQGGVDSGVRATFDEAENSVLAVVQYWLWNVSDWTDFDRDRAERDDAYARAVGNLNILTYIVRHNDANRGNFQISTDSAAPRVFAVDNGLSFSSEASDRGYEWRRLRVNRLPASSIERLRALTREELDRRLAVLAEFEVQNGGLVAVEPGPNFDDGRGIRKNDGRIQLGLTERELDRVWDRIQDILEEVDEGDIETFDLSPAR